MNAINWFEIPTRDLTRSKRFYEHVLAGRLTDTEVPGMKMALLPYEEPGVGGALVQFEEAVPHADGVRVYLHGGADLAPLLARVPEAGGTVVLEKTLVRPDVGYIALFRDLDGNVLGVHSTG